MRQSLDTKIKKIELGSQSKDKRHKLEVMKRYEDVVLLKPKSSRRPSPEKQKQLEEEAK